MREPDDEVNTEFPDFFVCRSEMIAAKRQAKGPGHQQNARLLAF
jgi:hypothetical protein